MVEAGPALENPSPICTRRLVRDPKQYARGGLDQHHQSSGSTHSKRYSRSVRGAQTRPARGGIEGTRQLSLSAAVGELRQYGPRNADEMRVLAKVLVWQLQNELGDRNELNLNGNPEREVWLKISAEDDACTSETCIKRTGGACPFHRAKSAAQTAHLLIVNHALLLSDVATGSKVLPEYSDLIVDEAIIWNQPRPMHCRSAKPVRHGSNVEGNRRVECGRAGETCY